MKGGFGENGGKGIDPVGEFGRFIAHLLVIAVRSECNGMEFCLQSL